jgi:hypothetical protein
VSTLSRAITAFLTSNSSFRLGCFPSLALLGYGKRFQKHRKLFNSVFSRAQTYTFEGAQLEEARFLVKSLIECQTPESYDWLVRRSVRTNSGNQCEPFKVLAVSRYATTLVIKIAYGHQILSDDDEYIKISEANSQAVSRSGAPGTTPPDFMPICTKTAATPGQYTSLTILQVRHVPAWVPGAWWSKYGRDWRFAMQDLFNIPFDRVRQQMVGVQRCREILSCFM